jgi:hypothetical protein
LTSRIPSPPAPPGLVDHHHGLLHQAVLGDDALDDAGHLVGAAAAAGGTMNSTVRGRFPGMCLQERELLVAAMAAARGGDRAPTACSSHPFASSRPCYPLFSFCSDLGGVPETVKVVRRFCTAARLAMHAVAKFESE